MVMRKYILILTFLPGILMAQVPVSENISISVSATVVSNSPVELTTLSNLILKGNYSGLKDVYISPVTNPDAGLMLAKGRPNSQARLSYIMEEILSDEKGPGKILLKYEMSGNRERVQKASKLIDTGEAILDFGEDGVYYLWVGCHIDLSNALTGKYIGQFTLEIEYL
jgi:hypothetical protein